MRDIFHIFHKDLRRLLPAAVLVWTCAAVYGWGMSRQDGAGLVVIGVLLLAAVTWAVCAVIQEERLVGNNQYWLTRPYSWRRLLAAKLLFVALVAYAPAVIAGAAALQLNGVPALSWLPGLLLYAIPFCIPFLALAAVTENAVEFVIAAVAVAAIEVLVQPERWPGVEWVRTAMEMGLALLATAAVTVLQYARRRTWWSRGLWAAGFLLVAAVPALLPWHAAFAVQTAFGRRLPDSAARLAFDSTRTVATAGELARWLSLKPVSIAIPVTLSGMPDGASLLSERIAVTIQGPNGASWNSGWTATGGLQPRFVAADGRYWMDFVADPGFAAAVMQTPVRIRATVALTQLGEPERIPLRSEGRSGPFADGAICDAETLGFGTQRIPVFGSGNSWREKRIQGTEVKCSWPFRAPAQSVLRTNVGGVPLPPGSYSALPDSAGVWASRLEVVGQGRQVAVETWQAVAHGERTVELPAVRLADYEVRLEVKR